MIRSRRAAVFLLALWCGAGVGGGAALWRVVSRPSNAFANRLVLQPRSGAYESFQLLLMLYPGAGAGVESGLLTVHTNFGRDDARDFAVMVPTLICLEVASEGSTQLLTSEFTATDLATRLTGKREPASPQARAEMRELWSVMRGADKGLATNLKQFRLVEVEPWERPRWFRRKRGSALIAMLVLTWLTVAAGIWRRSAGT